MAETNFKIKEKHSKLKTGDKTMNKTPINPVIPNTFLIIILPHATISNPSFKKPPTIGTILDIVYFATLIEAPSIIEAFNPCVVKIKPERVINRPIIHLNIDEKKSANLFIFILFVKQDKHENIVDNIISGKQAVNITLINPVEKKTTVGLNILAEIFPPEATIKLMIMGDKISLNLDTFSIVFLLISYKEKTCLDKIKIMVNINTI